MEEYPHLKAAGLWFLKVVLGAVIVISWGVYRWKEGFNTGADTVICAMAIAQRGDAAVQEFEACRNISDRIDRPLSKDRPA